MIHFYNSLTKKKELFKPQVKRKVLLYVCGVTVYDSCHLGHARVAINFDTIVRYLRFCGYEVRYIRNITDIDDKIIARAQQDKVPFGAISKKFSAEMQQDYQALGIDIPTGEPCASDHLKQIYQLIQILEEQNYTYKTTTGDVCYRVRNFANYGKLSGKKIDELRSGSRVEADVHKEDPLDFVLWKAAKPDEPSWESPWGTGRPGWHIECSAMAAHCLGTSLDVHGGGSDLIFPHHENEIAQSEAAFGVPLAKYWLHCGPLTINGKKMSKSLNNFISIQDLLNQYDAEVVKYFIHTGHYRSPLDFSLPLMKQAERSLEHLYSVLALFPYDQLVEPSSYPTEEDFFRSLNDDFNTPQALAALFGIARAAQKEKNIEAARSLLKCGRLLGILHSHPSSYLEHPKVEEEKKAKIESIIKKREQARKTKEWQQADIMRQELLDMGVLIQDTPDGTLWRIKK